MKLKEVPIGEVKNHLGEIASWNRHLNIQNIVKAVEWYTPGTKAFVYEDGAKWRTLAIVREDDTISTSKEPCVYLWELASKPGHGWGMSMTAEIIKRYKANPPNGAKWLVWTSDPDSGKSLLNLYQRHFPDVEQFSRFVGNRKFNNFRVPLTDDAKWNSDWNSRIYISRKNKSRNKKFAESRKTITLEELRRIIIG